MESVRKKLSDRFLEILEELADDARVELFRQGHRATGRGINSIEAKIQSVDIDGVVGVILANDYLVGPVDKGVSAGRIPFSGSGSGGTSRYIQGLMNWAAVVRPGLNANQRKSFAFAVANAHKQQGMPTSGSFRYSQNGRRKGWIENGIAKNEDKVERFLRDAEFIVSSFEESIAAVSGP